jgi:hypothetical protein
VHSTVEIRSTRANPFDANRSERTPHLTNERIKGAVTQTAFRRANRRQKIFGVPSIDVRRKARGARCAARDVLEKRPKCPKFHPILLFLS